MRKELGNLGRRIFRRLQFEKDYLVHDVLMFPRGDEKPQPLRDRMFRRAELGIIGFSTLALGTLGTLAVIGSVNSPEAVERSDVKLEADCYPPDLAKKMRHVDFILTFDSLVRNPLGVRVVRDEINSDGTIINSESDHYAPVRPSLHYHKNDLYNGNIRVYLGDNTVAKIADFAVNVDC